MIDDKKLKQVYSTLKQGGYNEDFNTFKSGFTGNNNYANRKQVYDLLSTHGANIGSTYEEFMQLMQKPKAGRTPMTDEDRARFSAGASAIAASAKQTVQNTGRYDKLKQRKQNQQRDYGRVNIGAHQTPYGGDANNVVKDDFAYNPTTGKTGTYVTSDSENAYNLLEAQRKQAVLDEQNNAYQGAVDRGEIPSVFDVRDKNGNYDLQENIGKNGTYLTEEGAQKQLDRKLQDAYARKKEIEDAIAEDNRKNGNPLLSYGASIGGGNGKDAASSDYRNKLATSLALVKQQIGALEAVKQYPTSSWGEDAWKALDNTAFTAKTWDFGLTDFATMGQMERIKAKMDNNIPLSDSDKMLLNSKLGADAAAALEDEKMGNIYRWTKIAGQSLPFMADFFLTGGYGGITRAASRGALKIAAKNGMGKLGAAVLKNTGIVIGDVVGSYAMAGTEQAMKTGSDIMQRHMGNLYVDENGNYAFGTFDENGNLLHEGGESFGTALYKGLTSAMVENYTEKLFGHNYGFKKGAINFMEKHGMARSAEFFKNIGSKEWYAGSKKWMEKFGINGFAEEVMEEEIGIPLHALLEGDNKMSDLLDPKQQLDIIGGMAISVGSMYAMGAGTKPLKGVYNRAQYYRFKHKVSVADSDAQELLGDKWADWKDRLDNATNDKVGGVLYDALQQRDKMSKEQINAIVQYGVDLMKMRGYNIAKTAEMNAKEITGEQNTPEEEKEQKIDDAYSEGHETEIENTHEIQIDQADKQKTLAQLLGITEQQLSAMDDEQLDAFTGQNDNLDNAIYEYQLSTARYQGVMDNAQDQVDLAAQRAAQAVDMYTDKSRGTVRNATIKATRGAEDYGVYIINGNLATHDDGSIDVTGSDQMILYYDPQTGKVEHADASRFAALGEELPAEDVKNQTVADAKEKAIKEIAGIIDGTVDVGSRFAVTDEQGNEHTYEVLADNGDGTVAITIDGNVEQNPYTLEQLQQMKDIEDQKLLEAAKAEREQMEAERNQQAEEQKKAEEQNDAQLQAAYNNLLDNDGNVVMATVHDGKHDEQQAFVVGVNQANQKPFVVFLNEDGSFTKPKSFDADKVEIGGNIDFDTFKAMMPSSSFVEDNSGDVEVNEQPAETAIVDNVETDVTPSEEVAQPSAEKTTEETAETTPSISLEDGTVVPMLEDGNPDFSQLTAAQTAELYDTQFGEDAEQVIGGWVSDAKKALDKANNMTVKGKNFVEQKASKDAKEKAIAEAQTAYESAVAIRDAYNERQLAKEEGTAEGRMNLIEKARRKFNRLKSSVKEDAEAARLLYQDTVGSLLHRLYDGTGIDVFDDTPHTVDEYVASNIAPYSLNYEGNETSKGVKQETGLSRQDFAKLGYLAADGKGTTIDAMVHSLWEGRPSNLENADTQEIRNALLAHITSGQTAFESRNYIQNKRIAEAENALEEQKRAGENAQFAEETQLPNEEIASEETTDSEISQEETPEVPEDATDEAPLGEQLNESDLPFSAKNDTERETAEERAANVERNKVEDTDVVDAIVGKKTRKALERIAKMMGAKIQYQYTDKLGNGWYDNTTNTIYLTLDSSIIEGVQFIFGHEMTHEIKTKNPAAYDELYQLVKDMMGEDAFNAYTAEVRKKYNDAGVMYASFGDYEEEVVADQIGYWLRDLNYAHTLVMKMSHPLLAKIHEIINRIRMAFYGTEYTEQAKEIMRTIEQAYVKTANREAENTAIQDGEGGQRWSLRTKEAPKTTQKVYKLMRLNPAEEGKLFPLFIGNGEAVELGKWYDADSPKLQDLKALSSKDYVATRTVSKDGKKVKEGYNYGAYLVNNETGEAMSLADFKDKYKSNKAFSRMGNNPNVAALNWATDNGYRWIKIEEKNQGQSRYGGENRSYYNYGINGTGSVSIFAMRPGWHAGSLPTMRQIGKGKDKNLRDDTFVWVEGEISADIDYNAEAQMNADKDIPDHIPTDGYYLKATNANKEASQADKIGWYVAGAFKPNRIMSDKETRDIIDQWNAEHPDEKVEYDWKRESGKDFNAETMSLEGEPKFSLKVYHGSGADFTEFDFEHMGEGAGSQAFGWGGYVTSSWEIARSYANLIDDDPSKRQYAIRKNNGDRFLKSFPTLESFLNNEYIKMGKFSEEEKIAYYNERAKDAEPYHNLYEVNIPDDNGKNYMDWDAPLTDEQQKNIYEALYDLPQDQLDKMAEDGQFKHLLYDIVKYIDKDRAIPALVSDNTITRPTLMDEYYIPNIGATAYSRIKRWLDSPKEASKFLSKAGFTGIKYYAGRNFGAEEGDINYVIFKPEDMNIVEHTKFSIKTWHGTGSKFSKFDLSHALEGEGSETFGHGVYVTNSKEIGGNYAQRAKDRKGKFGFEYKMDMSGEARRMLDHYINKNKDVDKGLENARQDLKSALEMFPDDETLIELSAILQKKNEEIAEASNEAYRYDVDIPDDNGENYLGWDDSQNFPLEKWYRLWEITHHGFNENEYFKDGGARYDEDRIERIIQMKLESPENGMQNLPTLKGEELYHALKDFFDRERPWHGAELASRALSEIGFIGIKYPAGLIHGGAKEGDTNYVIFDENNAKITNHTKFSLKDPYKMSDSEKKERGEKLINASAVDVSTGVIQKRDGLSARKVAEQWWKDNVGKPLYYDTEIGRVEINDNSIKDSLAHRYNQSKLDAITSLPVGFENAVYLGTLKDFTRDGDVKNHYFAYPINYDSRRNYVFCRAMQDANKNRLYVHEVFVADKINEGNTLQTAASQPHGGIALYKDILTNIISAAKIDNSSETSKGNGEKFSLKDEKTMFGMHNISLDKLRKAIKQGGFAAPSMGVIDSKNGIYSDYGEITLIPKAEKLAKSSGKNAGTFTADAWTPTYPRVEKIMNKQGEKAFWADMGKKLGDVDNGIYSNVTESWKNYFRNGDFLGGLYWHYLFDKGLNPTIVYKKGKYDSDVVNDVRRITANGNKSDYTDVETAELIKIMDKVTGEKNSVEEQRKTLEQQIKNAEKRNNSLLVTLKKKKLESLDGIEDFWIAYDFVETVLKDANENGKIDMLDTMRAAKNKVADDKKLSADFYSWLEKKSEEYGVEEMLYNGTTPSGKPKYIPNTMENAVKLMKKQGLAGGYNTFHPGVGAFIAKVSPMVNTLSAMKKAKDKLIPFGDERHNEMRDKIISDFRSLAKDLQISESAWDDSGEDRMQELAEIKPSDLMGYIKRNWNKKVSDDWVEKYNDLVNTIKNDYPVYYFETKFMRPYGLDEFEKAIVPKDTPKDVVDALKKAGIDVHTYEGKEDREKVTLDAINSSDDIKFSLKGKSEGWKQANKKAIHIAEAIKRDQKFSLKKLDGTLIKAGTYFSGGGLVEEGLKGIIDPVVAVEYDEKISGIYRNNFGQHIVTADVRDVDPKELVKSIDGEVEYFHASPVCKNFSLAKANHEEVELDKETASSTADFIDKVQPKVVTIENVKGYRDSEAMKIITDALDKNGYKWDADVYNAADYGGYTNRERLIVRAVKDGELPEKPKKMARKKGWYEAVEDIIPTLTEKKNGVAPWMDARLKADGIDWRNIDKPLYVMGSAYSNRNVPHAFGDELLPTLRTKSGDVIVMPGGKVYRAMGRVLARVSGMSDDYKLPYSEALAHTIIGNGIPTQLTEHVIAPLLNVDKPKFSPKQEKERIVEDAKKSGTYMMAPNGKKSKLNAEQWVDVRTDNFKKWFGDWENDSENASKVVDENGEPMVVYHGRSADFNTFERKEGVRFIMGLEDKVNAEGFFFSPNRELAEEFAGNASRHRGGKANVVSCFLNIRKPMDLTQDNYDRIYTDVTGWEYMVGMDTQDNLWGIMDEEGMADKIKAKGYDGAIFVEEVNDNYEPTQISYCALDANQIKSADNNNGDFSADSDDIRYSLRVDRYQHDLAQWKKDNGLSKDAERPSIPIREPNESVVDFANRVKEYRKDMALWKTAPKYEDHLLSDDTAQGQFNLELQRGSVLARIALQDSMLAIRKAQEAIMKEVGVDRLNIAEDAYTAENRSHGKGKNEFEEYNDEFLQPLRKAYSALMKKLGKSYDNVKVYMISKHGLERNAHIAFKKSLDADYETQPERIAAYKGYKSDMNRLTNDADFYSGKIDFTTWRQRDNAIRLKYAPSYLDYRYDKMGITQDYSGLSALFDGSDFEEAAAELVKDVESKYLNEVDNLWIYTNAATKKILRDCWKAGMMSDEVYDFVRGMYSHYIPLRGWGDTNADQVWNYVGGGKGAFNQTLKEANGRGSLADDPIAYIENMAESGILLNNKNWVKQHLLLLAENHPTSLLNVSKAWYIKTTDAQGNEEWIPASPNITANMTSQQVKNELEAFEKKMEQMKQKGDATQKREHLEISYPQTKGEEREHEVRVMKDGEEYVIYINGDPQLAQAMNNTRATRVRQGLENSLSQRVIARLGRKMAAAYTSMSPLFIPSNYFRDFTMTLASTAIREDGRYNYLLRKNMLTHWNTFHLVLRYQNGSLREKVRSGKASKTEQMFYDFMMNGGETGFVSSLDVEDLKKKFKNELKDMNRMALNPKKVGHVIMDIIETMNRVIEDSNRFMVYMTSIEYGRSIDEAVNDAKDVTLNFNRKGTGEHGWQTIRNLYLFINPAIQSLQTLGALAKHHPFKFTAVTTAWLASGLLVPMVNAALMSMFGGDDDKDKYWSFTKWDRRNNLIMWVGNGNFVKIPLAQEFRGFYGVGDMIASKLMGGEKAKESWEDYGYDLMGQVVDMLPLDPTAYNGDIAISLMPNAIRPLYELAFNVDFTGKPLFKESEYNKYDPNFTKAYAGTPDWLVRISKMVNSIGNDYPNVQQNAIDKFGDPRFNLNNPAVVDHVLSSYLGGAYTMGSQILGVATKALNGDDVKMADVPLASKFVSNPDDRPVSKKQGDEFWTTKERHDRAANTLSKLKKLAKVDGDYSTLNAFFGSDEYEQYKKDDKVVKKYEEDKKKERAEESGDEYKPHKTTYADIYNAHATAKDDFEDLKLSQLYGKVKGYDATWKAMLDMASSQADGYYNANAEAINAAEDAKDIIDQMNDIKKGFLSEDGKDAWNADDMKEIRDLRKQALPILEKANKVLLEKQKAKSKK